MLLRRVSPAALLTAAICACEPGVGYNPGQNPTQINWIRGDRDKWGSSAPEKRIVIG